MQVSEDAFQVVNEVGNVVRKHNRLEQAVEMYKAALGLVKRVHR